MIHQCEPTGWEYTTFLSVYGLLLFLVTDLNNYYWSPYTTLRNCFMGTVSHNPFSYKQVSGRVRVPAFPYISPGILVRWSATQPLINPGRNSYRGRHLLEYLTFFPNSLPTLIPIYFALDHLLMLCHRWDAPTNNLLLQPGSITYIVGPLH